VKICLGLLFPKINTIQENMNIFTKLAQYDHGLLKYLKENGTKQTTELLFYLLC